MNALQLHLRGSEPGLQQIVQRINAGFRSVLLNLHQALRRALLPCGRFKLPLHRVQLDIGGRGIQGHLLPCILQPDCRCLAGRTCCGDVAHLRNAKDQRLHRRRLDRWRRSSETNLGEDGKPGVEFQ